MGLASFVQTTTYRWTIGVALALLLQASLIGGLIYWSTVDYATGKIDDTLVADCQTLAGLPRADLLEEIGEKVERDVHRVELVGLFDAGGQAITGNIASLPRTLATTTGPVVVGLVRTSPPDPKPNPSRAVACSTLQGERIVVAQDTDEVDDLRALIERALIVATLPAILAAITLGLVLVRRGQARFREVRRAIDDVMAGDLDRRLPQTSSRDPIGSLSRAVNDMLDRLQEAIEDVRALGDDIAHELRTPLTRMRARLERGVEDASDKTTFVDIGQRTIKDIDHALSIVSAILRIRAIETAKRGSEFTTVDARSVLHDAVDLYRPIADESGVALLAEDGPSGTLIADRDLLMEAICNLIDNAIKFTRPGGRVRCTLTTDGDRVATIVVADTGPGIPPRDRASVFRRFHRGAASAPTEGHGIGLSLVAAIARLHRLTLTIEDAAPGCRITIDCRDGLRASVREHAVRPVPAD